MPWDDTDEVRKACLEADLIVNCTPIGMYPQVDATPIPAESLTKGLVYDLVYNPAATRLLREAQAAGCRTIGGLEMLVGQARKQFEWWTGVCPSAGVMRQAAIEKLREFTGGGDRVDTLRDGLKTVPYTNRM